MAQLCYSVIDYTGCMSCENKHPAMEITYVSDNTDWVFLNLKIIMGGIILLIGFYLFYIGF